MKEVPLARFEDESDREGWVDIGHDHWVKPIQWSPDRELNPQYEDIPDIEKVGIMVRHFKPDGTLCEGFIYLDTPEYRRVHEASVKRCRELGYETHPYHAWQVISMDPLHVEPSLQCLAPGCSDHGFIRGGRWVPA